MIVPQILWTSRSLLCATITTAALACGGDVEPEVDLSSGIGCATAAANGPWWNQAFAVQTGRFHVDIDVTPSGGAIDAVMGLAEGQATSFTGLAAAVRFNPAGMIDVRTGAAYRADAALAYSAGRTYRVRFDVDLSARTYTVWVQPLGQGFTMLAHRYAFRSEKAQATRLSGVAAKVDSDIGSVTICGIAVSQDAGLSNGCLLASAGEGFVSTALPALAGFGSVSATVTPSSTQLDAVIGLSADVPTSFASLANSLRLGPTGTLDVRDGGAYRADRQVPYRLTTFDVRMIVDLTTHTYSAFAGGFRFADEVGRDYAFRTQQQAVTHLDHLSAIVDGDSGGVAVCSVFTKSAAGVIYQRAGEHVVVPLPDDGALLGDGVTIRRVDSDGRTVAQRPGAGALAADPQGNVMLAYMDQATVVVEKYDAALTLQWRTPTGFFEGSAILASEMDAHGNVAVAVRAPGSEGISVIRLNADGTTGLGTGVPGEVVVLDDGDVVTAWNQADEVLVARFAPTAEPRWLRRFPGRAALTALAVDPALAVVLGGELSTSIDFGGGVLTPLSNPDAAINGFVVKFSNDGTHVFSTNTHTSWIGGIAANATHVVVSSTLWTQFPHPVLQWFDAIGTPVDRPELDVGHLGDLGRGGTVAIAPSRRTWWNLRAQWPVFPQWPFVVALEP
jgi:hypothetical protein